ncbi:ATP-binding protein involved in chromosome partitioning [Parasphingorhabdus marina DSM 22363]|uniref:Iron-sulfur cluster carrier protein n=1 Tax=Parasphingorhabdus marina DSM 22363 TaxID=1123272 RepID=A0A1N6CYD1_9SPHN|nr:Mrp/NBP35 family ATP-binding protein [Parasphingorhabdus marina]SIN63529.1 ATP-binding protein involved in chromosome partitioning [Parasphingorhabdus marina DSM 22363]
MTDISTIEAALAEVADGRFSAVKLDDGRVSLVLNVSGLDVRDRGQIEIAVKGRLLELDGVTKVDIVMTAEKIERRLIAVGSGKGGVGKSTLSTNLAIAMRALGRKVGMVDADIYGPSQPRLLNCEGQRPEAEGKQLIPVPNEYGIPVLSMGHLAKPGQAIAWRGPMAGKALEQLINAHWGDVEELIVDMPPGTGDVQLSMMQNHKPVGAVIVSTPQDLALMDAVRAVDLFEQAKIPVIGMVENMAGYACPHCGEISDPFGAGGAEAAAKTMNMAFLGRVPLDMDIRKASDGGVPPAATDGGQGQAFHDIAKRLVTWLDNQKAAA